MGVLKETVTSLSSILKSKSLEIVGMLLHRYPGSSRQETILALRRHEAAGHKMVAGEAGCVLLRDRSQSEVVRTSVIQF